MPRPPLAPATKTGTMESLVDDTSPSKPPDSLLAALGQSTQPKSVSSPPTARSSRDESLGQATLTAATGPVAPKPESAVAAVLGTPAESSQNEEELVAFLTASLMSLNRDSGVPDVPAPPSTEAAVVEIAVASAVAREPLAAEPPAPSPLPPSPRRVWVAPVAAALVLAGVGATAVALRSGGGKSRPTADPEAVATPEPRREPPKPVAPVEKPAEAPAPATSEASPTSPAPAAPAAEESGITKVTLTVTPPEAKVARPGRIPERTPVTYEVPKGTRIMVNVSCYGYQSKDLVIDGSKTEISLVLQRKLGAANPEPKQ
jgi:hypothetical protein